jgi:hypothetical protein
VDPGRADDPQRTRLHFVLCAAAADAGGVPALRDHGSTRIQLLPTLQFQAEPNLSAVPAQRESDRSVLSLLWDATEKRGGEVGKNKFQSFKVSKFQGFKVSKFRHSLWQPQFVPNVGETEKP